MAGRNVSHGRGGAGNIYSTANPTSAKDLITPTIKQDTFTTGRGGSGNMVQYDPERPEIARELQDVESPPQRVEEAPHHTGRGGAANAYVPTPEEEKKVREREEENLQRVRTASRDRLKDVKQASEKRAGSSSSR
ncbi:DUF3602 domain-containing protein [Aspergillus fischeri NRRL 181]|uniref:Uncharacterized protein n=1 Tax=Neosartorya fischeri (strain ATCC 1020 / DSM 3700 / CBS 544.65 / FGSC A1164 / JCM 1740 / NRRL 181 / WB 181) TaxID=331117 RepID=A1D566_NEOFI|nr:conserved hypothetical protein [Aspergillus fischeri NRRL 181]EAW23559.1 conserved hypothetical protein [Aspergillus fischeri NRRL 181]KAG2027639.1 hypothetical protein GB937_000079 [Aspergillus fischeri]